MTGLLVKELKYRGLVRRTLIVVPGHLKDQWLREMKERFAETFTVIDRNVMTATWGRNIWHEQAQVITSMDFAKQDDVMATLGETRWDLVVVDEAHKMAAYRYGDKTNKTDRYRFGELVERLTAAETREELQAEIQTLGDLIRLARDAERNEVETKLNELRKVIGTENLQRTGEKLLIFTESRETLDYLVEKLKSWGYSVVSLHGGMNLDARIRAEHEFREKAQVMVSTEAGGEGINLQFCSLMVNYDIPWNPNRLEQRMGRIHRYGQQKEVHIYNLVASDTREGKVLEALFQKLERIQKALGSDRVFDVIGEVIPGRSLKDLIVEAIAQRRTLDEIVAEIEAVPDNEAVDKTRQAASEALATRHIDLSRILGEDRRAREHRLVPEYIEQFFQRSCAFLGVVLEKRRDGLWRVPNVPSEFRHVSHAFKQQYGEVFREYNKLAFDKQIARSQEAVFLAPGHPLLESAIERLLVRCAPDVERGAVFADPDGRMDGWLWFLEGELRDGTNQIAGKSLFTVFQPAAGGDLPAPHAQPAGLQLANSSILWDLKPVSAQRSVGPGPTEEPVIAFAVDHVLESYRAEILQSRQREAAIKQKYGIRSLDQMILESDAKLIEYETRRANGEPIPDVEIRNEERRKEELLARKQALEDEIRRETSLLPSAPKILGIARVIPEQATDPAMRSDRDIEAIGMNMAMAYERAQQRVPEDVSSQNLGYDIRSTGAGGVIRYIEVKARAVTGAIVLTPNEWLMARRLGEEYWLYIVENARTQPILHTIKNPATKLAPQEVVEIVRYVIKDWKP